MKSLLLALILVLSFAATHLVAYGPSGHFIVAYLGRHFSTNETQGRLGRVIHSDDQLFSWANWADRIKSNSSYEWSFPLHYMNIAEPVATHLRINKTAELKSIMRPNWLSLLWSGDVSGFLSQWVIPPLTLHRDSSNQQVNMDVDCENSTCILTALANFTRRLNESQAGTTEHETNLKFLIHLMGDAHQVLHFCGIGRGGNDIECRYNGSTVNLHYVWDDLLLQVRKRLRDICTRSMGHGTWGMGHDHGNHNVCLPLDTNRHVWLGSKVSGVFAGPCTKRGLWHSAKITVASSQRRCVVRLFSAQLLSLLVFTISCQVRSVDLGSARGSLHGSLGLSLC